MVDRNEVDTIGGGENLSCQTHLNKRQRRVTASLSTTTLMISRIQLVRHARSFQPLARLIRTQAQSYDYVPREELDDHPLVRSAGLATPRQVFPP